MITKSGIVLANTRAPVVAVYSNEGSVVAIYALKGTLVNTTRKDRFIEVDLSSNLG